MMDFSLSIYTSLIVRLLENSYKFYPFCLYKSINSKKVVILRHDVDRLHERALQMAQLESSLGVNASYYFRIESLINNVLLIKKIENLGHEIGYHYEELDTVSKKKNLYFSKSFFPYYYLGRRSLKYTPHQDIIDETYELFKKNLTKFREITDIKTI